jgi:YHS domain-containing protein
MIRIALIPLNLQCLTYGKDHVCSMHIEENTPYVTEYDRSMYYFCSEVCKMSFDRNPQKYDDMAKKFSDRYRERSNKW